MLSFRDRRPGDFAADWQTVEVIDGNAAVHQDGLLHEALAEDSHAAVTMGDNVALACNVETEEAVAELLATAERAGARILKPAGQAFFGGVQGYFADPDGVRWEIAYNPGLTVEADGTVRLGAPD